MIKIAEHKIQKYGLRGFMISVPGIWVKDNKLAPGDTVEVFRDLVPDQLIIRTIPKGKKK